VANVKRLFEFTQKERVTHPQEFRTVMRFGKKIPSKNLILFMKDTQNTFHRLGIVASKGVGKATYRNRIKRLLREFFRLHKHRIKGAFDIVILVRKGCSLRHYFEVEKELRGLLNS
jgi:ribonuclease P protein component